MLKLWSKNAKAKMEDEESQEQLSHQPLQQDHVSIQAYNIQALLRQVCPLHLQVRAICKNRLREVFQQRRTQFSQILTLMNKQWIYKIRRAYICFLECSPNCWRLTITAWSPINWLYKRNLIISYRHIENQSHQLPMQYCVNIKTLPPKIHNTVCQFNQDDIIYTKNK